MIEEIVGGLFEAVGGILSELFGGLLEAVFEGGAEPLNNQDRKHTGLTGGEWVGWGGGAVERYKFLPDDADV